MLVFVQHSTGIGPAQRPCHLRAEQGGYTKVEGRGTYVTYATKLQNDL